MIVTPRREGIETAIGEYLDERPSRLEAKTQIALTGGEAGESIGDRETAFSQLGKNRAQPGRATIGRSLEVVPPFPK
jgi:hypothetical protein